MTTPTRNVRIPEPLWQAAKVKAEAEYTTVSAVIVRMLAEYVHSSTKEVPA